MDAVCKDVLKIIDNKEKQFKILNLYDKFFNKYKNIDLLQI